MVTRACAHTHTSTVPLHMFSLHILWVHNNNHTLVGLVVYSQSILLPLIQTSRDVSWKNILSLIKTQLSVTQSSLSSRKNLPSQTLLLKGFRKTHSSLEKLSHTQTTVSFLALHFSVSLHWLCTSFPIPLLLFVSLSPLSVLFYPLSLSLSLPLCPLSTSLLLCVW